MMYKMRVSGTPMAGESYLHYYHCEGIDGVGEFVFMSPGRIWMEILEDDTPEVLQTLGFSREMARKIFTALTKLREG